MKNKWKNWSFKIWIRLLKDITLIHLVVFNLLGKDAAVTIWSQYTVLKSSISAAYTSSKVQRIWYLEVNFKELVRATITVQTHTHNKTTTVLPVLWNWNNFGLLAIMSNFSKFYSTVSIFMLLIFTDNHKSLIDSWYREINW